LLVWLELFSCVNIFGCQKISITHEESVKINNLSTEIKEIIGKDNKGNYIIRSNDYYTINPIGKENMLQITRGGERGTAIITFYDSNSDGTRDTREVRIIPRNPPIIIIPSMPDPNEKFTPYEKSFRENKKRLNPGLIVYDN